MEKNPNPPMADDRSTKKARFKAQGEDGDNPQPHSFGDKLMSTQRVDEGVFFDSGEDLVVEPEDVVFECAASFLSLHFFFTESTCSTNETMAIHGGVQALGSSHSLPDAVQQLGNHLELDPRVFCN